MIPNILFDENIFESTADAIVNPINCVGAMGAGLALEFKKKYPDMYSDYLSRCKKKEVKIGEPYIYRVTNGLGIVNFPTKDHWKDVSEIDYIYNGMTYLVQHYQDMGIKSLAVPALGCGRGQLDWSYVRPILFWGLSQMDIPVEIYAPFNLKDYKKITYKI